jgi:hypothetical protein
VLNAFFGGGEFGVEVFKRKAPLWPSLKNAVLQNIISENLNWQATFHTSFSLPMFNKTARCNTADGGKIVAEKCIRGE